MKTKFSILFVFLSSILIMQANNKEYLKAHWDFESVESNILLDVSGNSENGKIIGNPKIVPGVVGKCMRFSGNDYIELFDQLFLDNECNITATCWFKSETDFSSTRQLFAITSGFPYFNPISFQFSVNKQPDFSFEDCKSGYRTIRSANPNFPFTFNKNEWYFLSVVLCFDGNISTLKIYINGQLKEKVSELSHMTEYTPLSPGKLCPTFHKPMAATIGALINYPDWNWIGCIDEMKFFTTCLSEEEIIREMTQDSANCIENSEIFNNSTTNGSATIVNENYIVNSNDEITSGSIWYNHPIPINNGFETSFKFAIKNGWDNPSGRYDGGSPGADGFAFVIQSQGTKALGPAGGDMGYAGINNSLCVEFDTYRNDRDKPGYNYRDPSTEHIAIKYGKNSPISAEHNDNSTIIYKNCNYISDGNDYYAKIKYSVIKETFQVFISKTQDFSSEALIDLTNFKISDYIDINKDIYFGFTGATGLHTESHEIHDWKICFGAAPKGDCDSSYFKYNSFNDISRLKLLDAARHQDNAIVLTSSQKYKKGAIFRDVPVPLAEEWECTWAFSMHSPYKGSAPDNSLPGADGISLIIHNDPRELEAIGNTGMGIAYAGIENAIAIEIDLFNNDKYQIEDMKDPNGNHIALMVNKDKGKLSAIHNDENPNFVNKNIFKLVSDGTKYYAKAYYNHNQRVLRVWLSKDENIYGDPVLDINNFNIRDYINFKDFGRAYIGIGAATGDANQTHVLHSWSLCPKTQYGTLISSVDDEEDTDYQFISPNPASDMLNVRLPNGITTGNIIIYGYMGNVVMNQYTSSSKNRIDISRLPIGVYFIKVLSGGTMHDVGKCIKQ